MKRGTCLSTYVPLRKEPASGSEMVNSLIFGESYEVLEEVEKWMKIQTDFDQYIGWISKAAWSEERKYSLLIDQLFLDCPSDHKHLYIPCGALVSDTLEMEINGSIYNVSKKLKLSNHLPLKVRMIKTALSFINTPYLWGGRTFMGIDCSGLTQIVYKTCGINLPRDTNQQINSGVAVEFDQKEEGDLAFFSVMDSDIVSHVGIILDSGEVLHAGATVRINALDKEGLWLDDELKYRLLEIRRIIN